MVKNVEDRIIIELTTTHRGNGSYTFTGRPQGNEVREELGFNKFDFDKNKYQVTIPNETISFNPSFYLGLFFWSVKNLNGFDAFKEKYDIVLLEEELELKELLLEDFDECERQSKNEFKGKTGIDLL